MQPFLSGLPFLLVTFCSFARAIPPPRAEPSTADLPASYPPASARIPSSTGRLVFSAASSSASHLHPRAAPLLITEEAFPPFSPYPSARYGLDVVSQDFRAYAGFRYVIRLLSTTMPRQLAYWYHDEQTDDYSPHLAWTIGGSASPPPTDDSPPENAPLQTWQADFTVRRDKSKPPPVTQLDGLEGYVRAEFWGAAPHGRLEVWELPMSADAADSAPPDSVTRHGQPRSS